MLFFEPPVIDAITVPELATRVTREPTRWILVPAILICVVSLYVPAGMVMVQFAVGEHAATAELICAPISDPENKLRFNVWAYADALVQRKMSALRSNFIFLLREMYSPIGSLRGPVHSTLSDRHCVLSKIGGCSRHLGMVVHWQ